MGMKRILCLGLIALLTLMLAACGTQNAEKKTAATESETEKIQYLGKEYKVPAKVERLVIAGSMESMEDALMLDVKPVGAMTVGGEFPALFKDITGSTKPIGEKIQPNMEGILKLKPDVILASTKFPEEVVGKLEKIAPTIPVSHVSSRWEDNLHLLAGLTGKQADVEKILQQYEDELQEAKTKLGDRLKDQKVMTIRIRNGNIMIYPESVFFNASLYEDLGLQPPAEVKKAKTQEMISLEKFSEMNPDVIFLQFSEDENKEQPDVLAKLEKNPIWKSIDAVEKDQVFVNVVDPLAQGGTAWSKSQFLESIVEKLSEE